MTADTVTRVPRPRGLLPDGTRRQILRAGKAREDAEQNYRAVVVAALEAGASFREVANLTGLSPTTLQKWKKDAR